MTQERETAAAAKVSTAKEAVFIANKNGIRIGDKVYNKGEAVPFVQGRNYESAVRQGTLIRIEGTAPQVSQMAQVLASGAAELERAGGQLLKSAGQLAGGVPRLTDRTDAPAPSTDLMHVAPVIKGAGAYWVGNDGAFSRVTVEDVQPIDPEAAEGLGLTPGQLAPKVIFEDEAEAEFVDPLALLPEQPTGRLIAELTAEKEAEGQQGAVTGTEQGNAETEEMQQIRSEHAAYQLIIKAMRRGAEAGTELPEKMPLRKTIINNGLHNTEAFAIVAEGGPDALTLLDRITDEQAHKLFEYALEQELIEGAQLEELEENQNPAEAGAGTVGGKGGE